MAVVGSQVGESYIYTNMERERERWCEVAMRLM